MKHRRNRKRFRHATKPWRFRTPMASAAVLIVATASGIVATQWHGGDARAGSRSAAFGETGAAGVAGAAGSVLSAPYRGESPLRTSASAGRASRATAARSPAPAAGVAPRASAPSVVVLAAPSAVAPGAVAPGAVAPGAVAPGAVAPGAPPAAPVPPPLPTPESSKVLNFQYQAQINGYYCGPAATRIALTARGKFPTQDAVAAVLGTTTGGTDSAADTTRALNSLLGETTYQTHLIAGATTPAQADQFQEDVVRAVGGGYAIVANIVGTGVDVSGAAHSYGNGHFLTVVGYRDDGRTVRVADPADPAGDGTYWMTTANFANWMARRGYSA